MWQPTFIEEPETRKPAKRVWLPLQRIVSWLFWINGKHKSFKARKHRITGKIEVWYAPFKVASGEFVPMGWIEIDRSWWNDFQSS